MHILGRPKAILFDFDGTLYAQSALRRVMLLRLIQAHGFDFREGWKTSRILMAYRKAQERLRHAAGVPADQIGLTMELAHCSEQDARCKIERWMETEPLSFLRRHMRRGLKELLAAAAGQDVALGVVSDYPADAKLAAMGLSEYFRVVVSAQDPEVQRFKPHPRGLEVALARLNVAGGPALYVGDRVEVDAEAARRAGLQSVIIDGRGSRSTGDWIAIRDYRELKTALQL